MTEMPGDRRRSLGGDAGVHIWDGPREEAVVQASGQSR
jgi:hypothetical protein